MPTKTFRVNIAANVSGNAQSQIKSMQSAMNAFKNSADFSKSFGNLSAIQNAWKIALSMPVSSNLAAKAESLQKTLSEIEKLKTAQASIQTAQAEMAKQIQANSQNAAAVQAAKQKSESLRLQIEQLKMQRAAVKRNSAEYKNFSAQIKQASKDLKSANNELKAAQKIFNASNGKTSNLARDLQSQIKSLHSLQSALTAAGVNVRQLESAERSLQASLNATTSALQRQSAEFSRMAANRANYQMARENLSNSYSDFQNATQTAGTIMSPFISATRNAVEYEYELKNVEALTQLKDIRAGNMSKVQAEMASLDKTFRNLGATTEYTSKEVAESAGYFAMAGWGQKQIESVMPAFMNLATATRTSGVELKRLADVFSDDMQAAGLKAGQNVKLKSGLEMEASEYFSDAFAFAVTNANLNRESLHESIKYFAPVAKQLGLDVSEMLATTMMTANAGIKGSQMGTAFRSGLIRMIAPPKAAYKALSEMGMDMSNAQKEFAESQAILSEMGVTANTFSGKIAQMAEIFSTMDREEKMSKIAAIFGKNALSAWAEIFESPEKVKQIAEWSKYMNSEEIQGYASDTANVMRESAHVQWEMLKSAVDAVVNQFGTALLPAVIALSQNLSPILLQLSEWISKNPQIVQGLAEIAATLSAVIVGSAGIKLISAAFGMVRASAVLAGDAALRFIGALRGAGFASLASEIGAVTASMRGLGTVAALAPFAKVSGWGKLGAGITGAFAGLRSLGFIGILAAGFGKIKGAVMAVGGALRTLVTGFGAVLRAGIAFAFSPIGAALMAIAAAAYAIYRNWDNLKPVFSSLANTIQGSIAPALQNVQTALADAGAAFGRLFESLDASGATDVLVKAFIVAVKVISQVLIALVDFAANVVAMLASMFGGLADVFKNALDFNWEGMKAAAAKTNDDVLKYGKAAFVDSLGEIVKTPETTYKALEYYDTLKQQKAGQLAPSAEAVKRHRMDSTPEQNSGYNLSSQNISQNLTNQMLNGAQNQSQYSIFSLIDNLTTSKADAATPAAAAVSNIDVSGVQEQLNTLGNSAVENATALSTNSASTQNVSTALNTVSTSATANSAAINANAVAFTANSAAVESSVAPIQNMAASADNSTGSISNLSSSSLNAASSLSGLGSAAMAAISSLMSAASSAASNAVANVKSFFGIGVAENASGGIYDHGAFLTWFAEKSPEAAIPLDGSDRAISLWQQAGQILGVYPAENYNGGIYAQGGGSYNFHGGNRSFTSPIVKVFESIINTIKNLDNSINENTRSQQEYSQSVSASQLEMAETLKTARESFSDEVKNSRSYKALTSSETAISSSILQKSSKIGSLNIEDLIFNGGFTGGYKRANRDIFGGSLGDTNIFNSDIFNQVGGIIEGIRTIKRGGNIENVIENVTGIFNQLGNMFGGGIFNEASKIGGVISSGIGIFNQAKEIFSGGNIFEKLGSIGDIVSQVGGMFGLENVSKIGGVISTGVNIFNQAKEIFSGGNVFESLGNIFGGGNFEQIGSIFNENENGIFDTGGLFDGGGMIMNHSESKNQSESQSVGERNVVFNITINAANVEDFSNQFEDYMRDFQRRAFF